jgi:hypothetical protein
MATRSTASKTSATKRLPSPLVLGNKKLAADKPLPGENPLPKMAKPSETILVNALANAEGFHRDALLIEISVGLALFASLTDGNKVDLPMKKALRAIYEKAGYACATPEGENCKSVQRWIGATAALFTHLGGHETIRDWVDDAPAAKHVARIQEALGPKKFAYISDVLTYVGKPPVKKPRVQKEAAAPAPAPTEPVKELSDTEKLMAAQLDAQILERKLAEASGMPPGRIFTKGPLQLAVPFNATYTDVMSLVEELMTFAKTQMPLPVDKGPVAQTAAS